MNVANLNVQASMLLAGVMLCCLPVAVARAETVISAVAAEELIDPLETVQADMFVNHTGDLDDFFAYQGICEVSGGDSGTLDLDDLEIDHSHPDWVFSSLPDYDVFDCTEGLGYALCASKISIGGIVVQNPGYLGTLTYLASFDAQGVFDINVDTDPDTGTLLLDSWALFYPFLIDDPAVIGVDIECFADSDCDDGNQCTYNDCNLGTHTCIFDHKPSGKPCTDGIFCNGFDRCDGNGDCSVHTGDPCTLPDLCCETTDSCYDPDPPPPQVPEYCPVEY